MKPIKVVHVVSVDTENYYLNNLFDHTDRREVELSFITLAHGGSGFAISMRERTERVTELGSLGRAAYPRTLFQILRFLRSKNPDIVHTHLFDPSIIGLTAAKLNRTRTVSTRHHSDAIHQIESWPKRKTYLALESYVSRLSDHIVAPSYAVSECLVRHEGVPGEKVSIIPYGQTTERFDNILPAQIEAVRDELGMGRSTALVCVSRLFHRKGHRYLFEALDRLKKSGTVVDVYLVGDGDHRGELERLAIELEIIDRVHFLGWRSDALAIIAAADLIVHPSLEDALSSAVIESLMLERPIVAADISGVRDSLDDGKYGKIVKPADAGELFDGIMGVLSDLDKARENARCGRRYLLEYMDAKRVAEAYTRIYFDLVVQK